LTAQVDDGVPAGDAAGPTTSPVRPTVAVQVSDRRPAGER
jgi:hypothetical protein